MSTLNRDTIAHLLLTVFRVRDQCQYVVTLRTPAACPIKTQLCAPNCPTTWLHDGECDPGCYNTACSFDHGDCSTPPQTEGQCAPGCVGAWRGDKECDEECDNEACAFDGGDCSGVCAPGCQPAWMGDGECDDECNTETCEADGGDCLRDGKQTSQRRCSWGCPLTWRGDKQCDIGCNVTACNFDDGDCGIFLPPPPPPPSPQPPSPPPPKPTKCAWTPPGRSGQFDLSPLADFHDLQFTTRGEDPPSTSVFAGHPLASLLGAAGLESGNGLQTLFVSLCHSNVEHSCHGERSPGMLSLPPGQQAIVNGERVGNGRSRCAVIGRETSRRFSLLDERDAGKGLMILYGKGDPCKPGKRMALLFVLVCKLDAKDHGQVADVQQRDQCMWVVRLETAAACPIKTQLCAPNCPTTWLHDGECDPGCYNTACSFDHGDCSTPPQTEGQCAPGCVGAWRGDKECDEECDNEACAFDGGDCSGVCAPGCQPAWMGDGECDDECNTETCEADGGDCLRDGKQTSQRRCSWGCPLTWRGDKQCDIGCNVTACNFDDGDCSLSRGGAFPLQWEAAAAPPKQKAPYAPQQLSTKGTHPNASLTLSGIRNQVVAAVTKLQAVAAGSKRLRLDATTLSLLLVAATLLCCCYTFLERWVNSCRQYRAYRVC